jgi:serine/threonine-protein kinase HipA
MIRKHSARPEIDLARLFRRLISFALIGNCDAHLKNFSLLETPVWAAAVGQLTTS